MKDWMLVLLAIGVFGIGIAIAELRRGHQPGSMVAQASVDDIREQSRQMAERMIEVIQREQNVALDAIRSDCRYRHPESPETAVTCIRIQMAEFEKLAAIWKASDATPQRFSMIVCMDENRTMHDINWRRVSACYERAAVRRSN